MGLVTSEQCRFQVGVMSYISLWLFAFFLCLPRFRGAREEVVINPKLYSWGYNDYGQLGLGDVVQRDTRVLMEYMRNATAYPRVVQMSAGAYHSAAVMHDGSIWTWGNNERGQLGHHGTDTTYMPHKVDAIGNIFCREVRAAAYSTYAVTSDAQIYGWGSNEYGQLGIGGAGWTQNIESMDHDTHETADYEKNRISRIQRVLPQKITTLVGVPVYSLQPAATHVLALSDEGTVYSWGSNEYGQLGHGDRTSRDLPKIISLLSSMRLVSIAVGDYHSLALQDTGAVWAWGFNAGGQLGVGDETHRYLPVVIEALNGANVTTITSGSWHSWAISMPMQLVYCWGQNNFGQLGLGDTEKRLRPVMFNTLPQTLIVKIVCGSEFTIALTDVGDVYSWGNNDYGSLGLGDRTRRDLPAHVTYISGQNIAIAAAGSLHVFVMSDCSNLQNLCSGAGDCGTSGMCECKRGYWGELCEHKCPGVPESCDAGDDVCIAAGSGCWGHGHCDSIDGHCECSDSTYRGYDCGIRCKTGWPLTTNVSAVATSVPPICAGHGICMDDGSCQCFMGYSGQVCEGECPGGVSNPCSSLGECMPDQTCKCYRGYTGLSCSIECAGGSHSPCSNNGECQMDGSCACYSGYRGVDCSIECNGGAENWCSGRGDCDAYGNCQCRTGYRGLICEKRCPGGVEVVLDGYTALARACSNHGECTKEGTCACETDYLGVGCEIAPSNLEIYIASGVASFLYVVWMIAMICWYRHRKRKKKQQKEEERARKKALREGNDAIPDTASKQMSMPDDEDIEEPMIKMTNKNV